MTKMIDWAEIGLYSYLKEHPEVIQFSEDQAKSVLEGVKKLIACTNAESRWWWGNTGKDAFVLHYGAHYSLIERFFHLIADDSVLIVVTGDYAPPWPIFRASIDVVIDAVMESGFVEYMLVSENLDWAIFDDHHNCLHCFGTISSKTSSDTIPWGAK